MGVVTAAIVYPAPLFAYSRSEGMFIIRSDRPIDASMKQVIADAERRLKTSSLHHPDDSFRLFICNESWRLWLLSRNGSVGGSTDTLLTLNIYIREADAASNQLVIHQGKLADAEDRPLSYFIAHEATHVLQARRFGRFLALRYPEWLVEGHADMVAKGGDFDLPTNRKLLSANHPLLSARFARLGLYRRYHLMAASLIQQRGGSVVQLFADPPSEQTALRAAYGLTPAP